MPDISLCTSLQCKRKFECKRFTSIPSEFNQSYTDFFNEKSECIHIILNNMGLKLCRLKLDLETNIGLIGIPTEIIYDVIDNPITDHKLEIIKLVMPDNDVLEFLLIDYSDWKMITDCIKIKNIQLMNITLKHLNHLK